MKKLNILGVKINNLTLDQALEKIREFLNSNSQHYITLPYSEFIIRAQKDKRFKNILNQADLCLCESKGLQFVARFLGKKFKQNISGVDLVHKLRGRIFLLGGKKGVTEKVKKKLNTKVVGIEHGYQDLDKVIVKINKAKPNILLVGLGSPKQEKWIYNNLKKMPTVKVAIGVGGAFDFISGRIKRAPKLIQEMGLEWLWRLILQPWRIKRVHNGVVKLILLALKEKRGTLRLNNTEKLFFVGIGGIGVSALAKMFYSQGKEVAGSDKYSSEITEDLKKQGIKVFIGHDKKNIDSDTELLIYSPAVNPEIPERKKATELGIKQLSYPEALGPLSKDKYTVAVSGTHGKSTTTAMLGLILSEAGLDPTVIVGSKLKHPEFNENLRTGNSKYFIIEACEWKAHMLKLSPKIIVLTNLEKDHLDYYKNFKNLKAAFKKYVKKLPKNGILIFNGDDRDCLEIAKSAECKTISYRFKPDTGFNLQIPGEFNIYNALAASSCASVLGVESKTINSVLNNFKGIWRRFENIGELKGALIFSDYAHHPTAIKQTIKAAKQRYPYKRIIVVYQPHHYDRTKRLFKDFVAAFDQADLAILNQVYDVPGRESVKQVDSRDLVKEISKREIEAIFSSNLKTTKSILLKKIRPGDLVLIMGAGDIYRLSTSLFANH